MISSEILHFFAVELHVMFKILS